jgi:hypothetical protein
MTPIKVNVVNINFSFWQVFKTRVELNLIQTLRHSKYGVCLTT